MAVTAQKAQNRFYMNIDPDTLKHIPRDLKPGEWQVFCEACGYKQEKNVAMKPICPQCGATLIIASECK